MADLGQAATTLGAVVLGAAIGSISSWLVAREQGKALLKQAEFQDNLARNRQQLEDLKTSTREQHQRRREVRSAPLLAFRAELAAMAQISEQLIHAVEQRARDGGDKNVEFWRRKWDEDIASGGYNRARLQLADEEIVRKAHEVTAAYAKALADANTGKHANLDDAARVVRETHELINQRLEAL